MPLPPPNRIESDKYLPSEVDVAIIGGGIAGISVALELSERGLRVAVFEKGMIAGEQSGRNWGWCRQMGRDPREVPLSKISLGLWRKMDRRINAPTGFHESGIAYLCQNERELANRQTWHDEQATPNGLTTHMLSANEAKDVTPNSPVKWAGGMLTPDDGRAEPQLAVPAMASAVQRKGGMVFENCAVRGLDQTAGKVSGVVTERCTVAADAVLLAGGAWSRRFCHNIGVRLPQLPVINSVMRTMPFEGTIRHSVVGAKLAIRKRLDGGYTIADDTFNTADIMPDSFRLLPDFLPTVLKNWGDYRLRISRRFLEEARLPRRWAMDEQSPFEQIRVLDPEPDPVAIRNAKETLERVHPEFVGVKMEQEWAGMIDVLPDIVPVIGPVDAKPGLFISTGYSGHGFGLGPGAGHLMAQLITGETPCVDPEPFSLNRF